MRGSKIGAGASGVCSNLSWDIFKLMNRQDWLSGGSLGDCRRTHRRQLRIEPLEQRHLLDAAGLASFVSLDWFETASDPSEHAGAAIWTAEDTIEPAAVEMASGSESSNLYDWIVQFDTAALAGVGSVAETAGLLVGGSIDFQVISGLGLVGQVLVRSSEASLVDVENWLIDNVHVASFEQDAVRQFEVASSSNDPFAGNLWGMSAIDAQDAWGVSVGSQSVVVAVIDTGVDYTHVDLAANIWTSAGEIAGNGIDDDGNGFVDDVHGYNFIDNIGDPMDDNGHGTHVSGTIAAVGDNGVGVVGVNWSTSIMALKFLNSAGQGYLSDAVRSINYATMQRTTYDVNVRVMNNSWGGGGFSSAMQNAIGAAGDAGILFVAAAGNSGSNNDVTPQYPANYTSENVISVAASTQTDQLAYFSCYGATTVDVAAPGVSIYSTLPGNRYGSYSGTSMATPHVAGLAALAWAVDPDASVAEIRSAILEGADSIAALSGKVVTGGRLNAYNTLELLGSTPEEDPVDPTPDPDPDPDPIPDDPSELSTVGVYLSSSSTFYLKSTNSTGSAGAAFTYTPAVGDWTAVSGDWNGDGQDTIGLYDTTKSRFYLRNSNDSGSADLALAYGPAGGDWTPMVGDWNGDGIDTVGLYNPDTSVFYLRNANNSGYADAAFVFGPSGGGWTPVVGDWNGDGIDTIGLYDPVASVFYLRDANNSGYADVAFTYGPANHGWEAVVGDWNGDGYDTVGLYDAGKSVFYLRNANNGGYADVAFAFGTAGNGSTPIIGDWDGSTSTAASSTASLGHEAVASPTMRETTALASVNAMGMQIAAIESYFDHEAGVYDRLIDSRTASLQDNLFSLDNQDDLLTFLDLQIEQLLNDASGEGRLSLFNASLRDSDTTDAGVESFSAGEAISAEDLLACCPIDQLAVDGVFDRLGATVVE